MLLKELFDGQALSAFSDNELEAKFKELIGKEKEPQNNLALQLITNEITRRKYQKQKEQGAKVI